MGVPMNPPTLEQRFSALFLRHEPPSKARQNRPQADKKYTKLHEPLSTRDVADLLTGRETYAVPLVGVSSLAYWIAADVDHGGVVALWRLLDAALQYGICGFAITSTTSEHDGGWFWALMAGPFHPERGRLLIKAIAATADVAVEAYPSGKAARLPLGRHRWTGKRGQLLLQDRRTLDLDRGERATLTTALEWIEALSPNSLGLLPHLPEPVQSAPRAAKPTTTAGCDLITTYNQTTDLISKLQGYGCRVAKHLPHGGVLLHCGCPMHKHRDQKPSLEVKPAIKAKYGRWVVHGYSPGCVLHTEQGQVFAPFDVEMAFEGLSAADVIKRHFPLQHTRRRPLGEPLPEPVYSEPSCPESTRERQARTAAERRARITDAQRVHAELRTCAEQDATLPKCARKVLDALLDVAKDRDWCRPSIDRLQQMTGYQHKRNVYTGLRGLEAQGYITSEEPNGATTTIRHLGRSPVENADPAARSPMLTGELILIPQGELTCKPPHDHAHAKPVPELLGEPLPEPVYSEPGGAYFDPSAVVPFDTRGWCPESEMRRAKQAAWEGWTPRQGPPTPDVEQLQLVSEPMPAAFTPLAELPAKRTKAKRAPVMKTDDPLVLQQRLERKRAQLPWLDKRKPLAANGVRRDIAKLEQRMAALPLPILALAQVAPHVGAAPAPRATPDPAGHRGGLHVEPTVGAVQPAGGAALPDPFVAEAQYYLDCKYWKLARVTAAHIRSPEARRRFLAVIEQHAGAGGAV